MRGVHRGVDIVPCRMRQFAEHVAGSRIEDGLRAPAVGLQEAAIDIQMERGVIALRVRRHARSQRCKRNQDGYLDKDCTMGADGATIASRGRARRTQQAADFLPENLVFLPDEQMPDLAAKRPELGIGH